MHRLTLAALTALTLCLASLVSASQEPFKLGTFEYRDEQLVGIVLRDQLVVDLSRANRTLERHQPLWVKLPMPEDMKELIGRYEYGMRERIHAIVDIVLEKLDGGERPDYVHDLGELHVFPPVDPGVILAAALNYWSHAQEMTTGTPADMSDASALDDHPVSMEYFWERKPDDRRQNPYLFFKPPRVVIGHESPILMKPKREQMDWECEFAVVIGQPASHVPIDEAREHVFGYTLMNDVGDREGRGDNRYGLRLARLEEHRHLRSPRPVHRSEGVRSRSAEAPYLVRSLRQENAGRFDRAHAALDRRAPPLRLEQPDPEAR